MPSTQITIEKTGGSYFIKVKNLLRKQDDFIQLHGDELLELYYEIQKLVEKDESTVN